MGPPALDGQRLRWSIYRGAHNMYSSAGPWLANLVMDHADDLSAHLAATVQRQIPFYATWERERINQAINLFCQSLAQVFATGDMAPVRVYLERLVGARLGQRTAGTDYIWLLDRLEESMRALIERQAGDPRRLNEAHRLVRSTSRNARLIISEINLQLLTRASSPASKQAVVAGK